MSEELKPCPFCGSSASLWNDIRTHFISCGGCSARGGSYGTTEEAIDAWNRRADPWRTAAEAPIGERVFVFHQATDELGIGGGGIIRPTGCPSRRHLKRIRNDNQDHGR